MQALRAKEQVAAPVAPIITRIGGGPVDTDALVPEVAEVSVVAIADAVEHSELNELGGVSEIHGLSEIAEAGDELSDLSDLTETVSCVTFDASPDDMPETVAADASVSSGSFSSESLVGSEGSLASPQATNLGGPMVSQAAVTAATDLSSLIEPGDKVSRKELIALLESFVKIIKSDDDPVNGTEVKNAAINQYAEIRQTATAEELARAERASAPMAQTPNALATVNNSAPQTNLQVAQERTVITTSEASVDDRTEEIDQLRGLVIEAQDTIIKLLTDRVEDRSRIATLEAQLNLLPDLQAQADRAMAVAVRTEEYRTELNKMKFELDRFRLFRVRIEAENRKATIFNRIQKWLFTRATGATGVAANPKDETLQNSN